MHSKDDLRRDSPIILFFKPDKLFTMVRIHVKITGIDNARKATVRLQNAIRNMAKASEELKRAEAELLKELSKLDVEYSG